jgi:hypothetical protein
LELDSSEFLIHARHFRNLLAKHAPDHPLRNLRIMQVRDAMRAAGIDAESGF